MKTSLIALLFCCAVAKDILLDGGFEGRQWDIAPTWALCSIYSCSVLESLQPGAHSGNHFLMIYSGRRVTIGQKFNTTRHGYCQLGFYLKTTSEIDTSIRVFWGTDIHDINCYEGDPTLGQWNYYTLPLSGDSDYLEMQFVSGSTAMAVADDFSLICESSTWSWAWTGEMIALAVVAGVLILTGYKLVQQRQLLEEFANKYNIHRPAWLKRKPPAEVEIELKDAFIEDSE